MKVLHIITGLEAGGAEIALYKLISSTPEVEHAVIALKQGGPVAEMIEKLGVSVSILKVKGRFNPFLFLRLLKLARSFGPEIVQSWMLHANFVAYYLCRYFYRKPLVWGVRCTLAGATSTYCNKLITRYSSRISTFPKKIVYNTRAALSEFSSIHYCKKNSIVIPNGFDVARYVPDRQKRLLIRKKLSVNPSSFVIGCFARYDPMKNHAGLLSAFAEFVSKHPDSLLLLVGKGVDHSNVELDRKLDELNLTESVKLLGYRADIPELLCSLDVFCLPSLIEAFSNAQGEAMASGVPCIVTDVGDGPTVLGGGGIVVEPGSEQALSGAMKQLYDLSAQERSAIGLKARQRIIDHYSIASASSEFLDVYKNI